METPFVSGWVARVERVVIPMLEQAAGDPTSEEAQIVAGLLLLLDPREEQVIKLRFGLTGKPQTLAAIGEQLGVSGSGVGSIRDRALRKMGWQLKNRLRWKEATGLDGAASIEQLQRDRANRDAAAAASAAEAARRKQEKEALQITKRNEREKRRQTLNAQARQRSREIAYKKATTKVAEIRDVLTSAQHKLMRLEALPKIVRAIPPFPSWIIRLQASIHELKARLEQAQLAATHAKERQDRGDCP